MLCFLACKIIGFIWKIILHINLPVVLVVVVVVVVVDVVDVQSGFSAKKTKLKVNKCKLTYK